MAHCQHHAVHWLHSRALTLGRAPARHHCPGRLPTLRENSLSQEVCCCSSARATSTLPGSTPAAIRPAGQAVGRQVQAGGVQAHPAAAQACALGCCCCCGGGSVTGMELTGKAPLFQERPHACGYPHTTCMPRPPPRCTCIGTYTHLRSTQHSPSLPALHPPTHSPQPIGMEEPPPLPGAPSRKLMDATELRTACCCCCGGRLAVLWRRDTLDTWSRMR